MMKSMISKTQTERILLSSLLALFALALCGCGSEKRTRATAEKGAAVTLLDDCSDAGRNNRGVERLLIDDKGAGSQSRATMRCEAGVLSVSGELAPGRGAPAFISVALPLAPEGKPQDVSGYEGLWLRVKAIKGPLSIQVATATITNFDYHTSAPLPGKGSEFQEVRLPFKDLKRAWSEQTPLDLERVTSVNLVSFGMARNTFAYEVDEIGFY
jgi:hypothetical protein